MSVLKIFFPDPPYSHLLTRPVELQSSPIKSLITALSLIKAPAVGLYQIVFQPVDQKHNWHQNVQILLDFEYTIKLQGGFHVPQRYAQQSPLGDLKQMAWEVENKAHNDKPFYAVALRMAVANTDGDANDYLEGISTFASLFQHGGRPLRYITEKDYAQILSPNQCRDMFLCGLTYRPGFLVNSLELGGYTGTYSNRQGRSTFELPDASVNILPIVCFESIFGPYVSGNLSKKKGFITMITNDGWWKNTPGYRHHFNFSPVRAIENRRDFVRVANTGISAIINAKGLIIAKTPWWEKATLKGKIHLRRGQTFFARHGDYLGRISLILTGLLILYAAIRKLKNAGPKLKL